MERISPRLNDGASSFTVESGVLFESDNAAAKFKLKNAMSEDIFLYSRYTYQESKL